MSSVERATDVDVVGNNLDSVTPVPPPIEAVPRLSDVLRAGLVTGITAALVCWLLFGIARLFGTEMTVTVAGETTRVAWWMVLTQAILSPLIFSLIAAAFRKHRNCRRTTAIVGYVLGIISLAAPLLQGDTWPTKIWLVLMHIVTILIVVPQVARVVGDSDPHVTAGYRRSGLDA